MNQNLYPIYKVDISDKGAYFKKSRKGEPRYFTTKGRTTGDGWVANYVLCLGADELYVVHWVHESGNTGTWFLDSQFNRIIQKNLLSNPAFKETRYSQLWAAYLKDIIFRVWYTLITPALLYNHPDFSPTELFISHDVIEDLKFILNSILEPCQIFNIGKVNDELTQLHPSIQKEYIQNGLSCYSTYTENWQDQAIANGYIEIPSPFSGKLITSHQSVLFSVDGFTTGYLFQDQGESFFLVTTGHKNIKNAYFFPRKNILITSKIEKSHKKSTIQANSVNQFYVFILRYWKLIKPYLLSQSNKPRAVVTSGREPHIGHYLWNELSGLARLEYHGALKNVACHYVDGYNREHFGPLDVIFPQLAQKVMRLEKLELPRLIYEGSYFYVKPGDSFVSSHLTEKAIAYAQTPAVLANCSDELKAFNKQNFSFSILFTLRIGNRSWLNQEQGICEVITKLAQHYEGKIALIIDGHNTSSLGERLKSYREDLIKTRSGLDLFEEEYEMAERIKHRLSSDKIMVINTIGVSVQESLNWSLLCDFFVAPWGAGLAKYKWVTNTPGLVFSSREVLTSKPDLHIYDDLEFREYAYSCEYLALEAIEDIEDDNAFGGEYRKNFNLSVDMLYKKIIEMCEKVVE